MLIFNLGASEHYQKLLSAEARDESPVPESQEKPWTKPSPEFFIELEECFTACRSLCRFPQHGKAVCGYVGKGIARQFCASNSISGLWMLQPQDSPAVVEDLQRRWSESPQARCTRDDLMPTTGLFQTRDFGSEQAS
ncbi:hypothetical protein AV530_003479 [Patagioenas fasciata monilis]|uniref:Uncharacterized protein n=1 Tax=Patagioenas fasciata monilis TaxID=372326 RepID=A0A1V4K2V0_PATFA|nr:hypothetical protein AV530_003479 [Patagioenas fasciata monilis]